MKEISTKTQMGKIRFFEKGFMATHLINLGGRLGIFEALNENKEGMTVSALASKLGLHEPYLRIWCQTAYHFEILDCVEQSLFKLQPFLDEILGDRSHFRNYLGNIAMDVDIIAKGMSEAPGYFRSGKAAEVYHTPEFSQAIYEPTKNIPLMFLAMILPKSDRLRQLLEKGISFLDIGCGNGNLIIQLALAFKNSTFVGVGPDGFGIKAAESTISQLGLESRVSVKYMGGEDLPYEDEFDIVSMVVTLHEIPPDVRGQVVRKGYQALKKDGYLLVLDLPYPAKLEDFRNPVYDYGILDQFYEICIGTIHLSSDQQDEILTNAGFKNIQRMPIGEGMFGTITARK